MHREQHPYGHYDGSQIAQVALVANTPTQIVGSSKVRRRLILSISSTSAAVPSPVRFGFGQPPTQVGALVGAFELNSVVPQIVLRYEDWGGALCQAWWAFNALGTEVYVTEILDSSPDCECYG
jgi:hypothetical protein